MQDVTTAAIRVFKERFAGGDCHVGWSPGRVNLIGEYTDLNSGYVMPMAIDRGIAVVLRPRSDRNINAYSVSLDAAFTHVLETDLSDSEPWVRYVAGTIELARREGCEVEGCDVVVHANLPASGGLSSSAALTTAICLALRQSYGWSIADEDVARLCQQVEHQYLNVLCGLMDQLACLLTRRDTAVFVDCGTLAHELVPFAEELGILIVDSGVDRALHSSAYNARRQECHDACSHLVSQGYDIRHLSDINANKLTRALVDLPDPLANRVRHVVTENERTLAAKKAMVDNDPQHLGELMLGSHASLRDDFKVSVAELDFIVDSAMHSGLAYGARLSGAGFGGNAIVLAQRGQLNDLRDQIGERFRAQFSRIPDMYEVGRTNEASAMSLGIED